MRAFDLDVLEPRKDPDEEFDANICSHCGHKILATEEECSWCSSEKELEDELQDEFDDGI